MVYNNNNKSPKTLREWVKNIISENVKHISSQEWDNLHNGVVACRLMNALIKNPINFNENPENENMMRENLIVFREFCDEFGVWDVPSIDMLADPTSTSQILRLFSEIRQRYNEKNDQISNSNNSSSQSSDADSDTSSMSSVNSQNENETRSLDSNSKKNRRLSHKRNSSGFGLLRRLKSKGKKQLSRNVTLTDDSDKSASFSGRQEPYTPSSSGSSSHNSSFDFDDSNINSQEVEEEDDEDEEKETEIKEKRKSCRDSKTIKETQSLDEKEQKDQKETEEKEEEEEEEEEEYPPEDPQDHYTVQIFHDSRNRSKSFTDGRTAFTAFREETESDYNVEYARNSEKNEKQLNLGSLKILVQHLTKPKGYDNEYLHQFLVTYRSFTTAENLLRMLIERFNTLPKDEEILLDHKRFGHFLKTHLIPVRLRVAQTIKSWIEQHFYDFREDIRVGHLLRAFVEHISKNERLNVTYRILNTAIDRKAAKRETFVEQQNEMTRHMFRMDPSLPAPRYPKSYEKVLKKKKSKTGVFSTSSSLSTSKESLLSSYDITDWPPIETARQLTIAEFEAYARIRPKELLNQNWNAKSQKNYAPNIYYMIRHSNKISSWIAHEILKLEKSKDRAKMIKYFIKVANEMRRLNNLNGLTEVTGGLNSVPIHRLTPDWENVSKRKKLIKEELDRIVSQERSFKTIREYIKTCEPPCIPYIGVFLTDLTFIEDGNKDNVIVEVNKKNNKNNNENNKNNKNNNENNENNENNNEDNENNETKVELINWNKRRMLHRVIREIQTFQQTGYSLNIVMELRQQIEEMPEYDDEKLYQRSLEIKPRK